MKKIVPYLFSIIFGSLIIWFLFIAEILNIGNRPLALVIGGISIVLGSIAGTLFNKYYIKKNKGTGIRPKPDLTMKQEIIFFLVAYFIWVIIVLTNG